LVALGDTAKEAALQGLRNPEARVRELCCVVLDRVADSDTFRPLVGALDDPAPEVRLQALHALACDRCKTSPCELDDSALPRATDLLLGDPDAHVRAMAVELVGKWVHTHAEASDALASAMRTDPSSAVRKKASWYAPGGAVFRRTLPKQERRPRATGTSARSSRDYGVTVG
jgi:HEAT repeat protein